MSLEVNHDRWQDGYSDGKCWVFGDAHLEATDSERFRQPPTTGNENIDVSGPSLQFLVVVRCRNQLATFLQTTELVIIENPEFVVGISMLSVIVPDI